MFSARVKKIMLMTEETEMVRQGLQKQTVLVFICGQDATIVPTGD